MNLTKSLFFLLPAWITIFLWVAPVLASGESELSTQPVKDLLWSIESNDFETFIGSGTPEFKQAVSREVLQELHYSIGLRLAQGYHVAYLGRLARQAGDILLWKLEFQDQGDDMLIRLVLEKDRVSGFWLH